MGDIANGKSVQNYFVFIYLVYHESNLKMSFMDKVREPFTVVPVAGEGGIGEDEVVDVGVLLEWWKISSSMLQ